MPHPTQLPAIKPSHTRINPVSNILLTLPLLIFLSPHLRSLSFPRRFLTAMSNPNPRNPNFPTPQSLLNWLQPRLPSDSFSTWGTCPGTKNVHNLWLELTDGETTLIDSIPPLRYLEVVCVRVRVRIDSDLILIESGQVLSDGSIRKRGRILSEKMKAGEVVELAARRAIKEEIGVIDDERIKIVMDYYERKVEEKSSVSYPGLPACYVLHYVDAVVDGLPEGDFITDEFGEEDHEGVTEAIKVKKHFWKWVSAADVVL